MAEAEVIIDASKGALTVKGEQSFVVEVLEKYRTIFENVSRQEPAQPPAQPASGPPSVDKSNPSGDTASKPGELAALSSVFDINGSDISILVSAPGKTLTAQARALILLYLYARFRVGDEPVPAEAIKEQCKAHACFDPKNFSSHLKSQKNYVTVTGTNNNMTARLTVPGRKAAEDLAQSLQNAS